MGSIEIHVGETSLGTKSVTKPSSGGTTPKTFEFTATTDPLPSGKVKITVNCTTNSIYIIGIAITEEDTRTDAELKFSQENATQLEVGETSSFKAEAKSDGAITYTSSNPAIATIDENGFVRALSDGDTEISATIAATSEYKAQTITSALTVIDPNKPAQVKTPLQYREVTSTEELVDGGQYVIVSKAQKQAMTGLNSSDKGTAESITFEDDGTIKNLPATTVVYTLSNISDGYFNLINAEGKMLTCQASGTSLYHSNFSATNNTGKWTINSNKGIISKGNTANDRAILNNGSSLFGHYAVSNLTNNNYYTCQLYRLETSATISDKIGYTTFYTDKQYQLNKNLTAYAISAAEKTGEVTMTTAYEGGEDIPNNMALMLGGEPGTYSLPILKKTIAPYTGDNMLEGRRTADNFTNTTKTEDVYYYKLTLLDGKNPGFYWGAANGAAFEMKNPNTAYLAVPVAIASTNGFRIVMSDNTTGIDSAAVAPAQNAAIYTLSGIRVNATNANNLPKGIYVVNGKKLIVK